MAVFYAMLYLGDGGNTIPSMPGWFSLGEWNSVFKQYFKNAAFYFSASRRYYDVVSTAQAWHALVDTK